MHCISAWNSFWAIVCVHVHSSEDEVMGRRQAEELLMTELQYSRERVLKNSLYQKNSEHSTQPVKNVSL